MTAITTQHTPGPWAAHLGFALDDGSIQPLVIFTDDGHGNGDEIPFRNDYEQDWKNAEAEANRCLIDAAPELLKVLESIVRNHSLERVQTQLDGTDLYDALRAIAKAKGGAA